MDICDIDSCDRHENGQIKVEYLATADHENPNPATREPKHPEDRRRVRLRATMEFLHLAISTSRIASLTACDLHPISGLETKARVRGKSCEQREGVVPSTK